MQHTDRCLWIIRLQGCGRLSSSAARACHLDKSVRELCSNAPGPTDTHKYLPKSPMRSAPLSAEMLRSSQSVTAHASGQRSRPTMTTSHLFGLRCTPAERPASENTGSSMHAAKQHRCVVLALAEHAIAIGAKSAVAATPGWLHSADEEDPRQRAAVCHATGHPTRGCRRAARARACLCWWPQSPAWARRVSPATNPAAPWQRPPRSRRR